MLLEHPFQTVGRQERAGASRCGTTGAGRSLALTTDSSWYWASPRTRGGAPSRAYDRFWGNALRWLVRDPDLTTLKVTADPPSVEPGKPVGVVVAARDGRTTSPRRAPQVRVELFSVATQKLVAAQTGTDRAGRGGAARVRPARARRLQAGRPARSRASKALGEGEDAVAVRAVGPELSDASVRPELLERHRRG